MGSRVYLFALLGILSGTGISVDIKDGAVLDIHGNQKVKWPDAVIPYIDANNLHDVHPVGVSISEAMAILESTTCIQFQQIYSPMEAVHRYYLYISPDELQTVETGFGKIDVVVSPSDQIEDVVRKLVEALSVNATGPIRKSTGKGYVANSGTNLPKDHGHSSEDDDDNIDLGSLYPILKALSEFEEKEEEAADDFGKNVSVSPDDQVEDVVRTLVDAMSVDTAENVSELTADGYVTNSDTNLQKSSDNDEKGLVLNTLHHIMETLGLIEEVEEAKTVQTSIEKTDAPASLNNQTENVVRALIDAILANDTTTISELTTEDNVTTSDSNLPRDYDLSSEKNDDGFALSSLYHMMEILDEMEVEEKMNEKAEHSVENVRSNLTRDEANYFNEIYKCPQCSHTLRAEKGSITPLASEQKLACEYRVTVPEGHVIVFETINDEACDDGSCEYNSFDVYDGDRRRSHFLGSLNVGNLTHVRVNNNRALVIKRANTNPNVAQSSLHFSAIKINKLTGDSGFIKSSESPPVTFLHSWQVWRIELKNNSKYYVNISTFIVSGEIDCLENSTLLVHKDELSENQFEELCENYTLKITQLEESNIEIEIFGGNGSDYMLLFGEYAQYHNACADIDHGCQHHCEELEAGYKCGCDDGHQLGADGRSCTKMSTGNASTLLIVVTIGVFVGFLSVLFAFHVKKQFTKTTELDLTPKIPTIY